MRHLVLLTLLAACGGGSGEESRQTFVVSTPYEDYTVVLSTRDQSFTLKATKRTVEIRLDLTREWYIGVISADGKLSPVIRTSDYEPGDLRVIAHHDVPDYPGVPDVPEPLPNPPEVVFKDSSFINSSSSGWEARLDEWCMSGLDSPYVCE